ncbi:MAG: ankyrin repeat domain-containing protein, partial [Desulfobacterales bacterium]
MFKSIKRCKLTIPGTLCLMLVFFSLTSEGGDPYEELKKREIAYSEDNFVDSAGKNDTAVIKLFLDAGMDVNAPNAYDLTALMAAAFNGHSEAAQLLIDRGANVNFMGRDRNTALMG